MTPFLSITYIGTIVVNAADSDTYFPPTRLPSTIESSTYFTAACGTAVETFVVDVSFTGALVQPAANSTARTAAIITTKLVYFVSSPTFERSMDGHRRKNLWLFNADGSLCPANMIPGQKKSWRELRPLICRNAFTRTIDKEYVARSPLPVLKVNDL